MINIDDFVREKLNGHPQKDDSAAAWLKMKELLDKEQPEKVAPFLFRWRKPMAFFGAAILLSVLCVGGYEINKLRQVEEKEATVSNNKTKTHSSKTIFATDNDSNPTANQAPAIDGEQARQSSPNSQSENKGPKSNSNNLAHTTAKINSNATHIDSENQNAGTDITHNTQVPSKKEQSTFASNSPSNNKKLNADKQNDVEPKNNLKKGIPTSQSENEKHSKEKSTVSVQQNTSAKNAENELAANNSTDAGQNKINARSNNLKENKTTQVGNPKNNNDANFVSNTQDSIPTTTIVTKEKSSKGFPRKTVIQSDTIASGKVALPNTQSNNKSNNIVKNTQASESNQSIAQGQNKKTTTTQEKRKDEFAGKTPNATSIASNNAEQKNNSTIAKKEKSKAAKWFDNLNLPQAAADAKRDFKNAQFYAGFSAGANYSISNNNNFQGVQFGPTGELVFNKHWSLFGAINYFNRSGGKKTVNDSYAKEIANDTPSISGANWYYKVHSDSTNRFFNFSTLHSFELPLTIRYAFQKFYVMTGINLAYYLGVNVEEVKKSYNPVNEHFVQTNSTKPILKESKPSLAISDFGSKFGLGYVIGAGYQLAPSWQTDLRVVNNFWDNSKGNGAQKLSKDFYKLPSLQISIGYQFNRGKSKPTFGPTDSQ